MSSLPINKAPLSPEISTHLNQPKCSIWNRFEKITVYAVNFIASCALFYCLPFKGALLFSGVVLLSSLLIRNLIKKHILKIENPSQTPTLHQKTPKISKPAADEFSLPERVLSPSNLAATLPSLSVPRMQSDACESCLYGPGAPVAGKSERSILADREEVRGSVDDACIGQPEVLTLSSTPLSYDRNRFSTMPSSIFNLAYPIERSQSFGLPVPPRVHVGSGKAQHFPFTEDLTDEYESMHHGDHQRKPNIPFEVAETVRLTRPHTVASSKRAALNERDVASLSFPESHDTPGLLSSNGDDTTALAPPARALVDRREDESKSDAVEDVVIAIRQRPKLGSREALDSI
jgi:hypothetical protein